MGEQETREEAARKVTVINDLLAAEKHQAALEKAYELKRFLQGRLETGEALENRLAEAESAIATLEAAGYRAINIELPDVRGAMRRLAGKASASSRPTNAPPCPTTAPLAGAGSWNPAIPHCGTGSGQELPLHQPLPVLGASHGSQQQGARPILPLLVIAVALVACIPFYQQVRVQVANRELQSHMAKVLSGDSRNSGISVQPHLAAYGEPRTLVYDLTGVSSSNSMSDVFRVLLQYAHEIGHERFDTVELAFRGKKKFRISGEFFHTLGAEYGSQNPIYTVRTFPENLKDMDGSRAYSEWTGGLLGVANRQMEDFSDFHHKWYIDERE